jgi:hypothetical protein
MTEQAISPSVTTQAVSPSVSTQAISPLRQRMIEDMAIRKFTAKTQHDYVQRVKDFATFLGSSPRTAESEDVRRFQLASHHEGGRHADHQRHRLGAAVLFHRDAQSRRPRQAAVVHS